MGNETVTVREKGWVTLTTRELSATDLDTSDNFLVFDILEYPSYGNIQIGELVSAEKEVVTYFKKFLKSPKRLRLCVEALNVLRAAVRGLHRF